MVPIRLQVRQFTTESSPVKTPSYNPGIRMYYTRGSWRDEDSLFYLSAGLHHYSTDRAAPITIPTERSTPRAAALHGLCRAFALLDRKYSWTKFNFRKYLIGGIATWEPAQSHYYEKASPRSRGGTMSERTARSGERRPSS